MRIVGVNLDSHFDHHISNTVHHTCNYHIRSLWHSTPLIDRDVATVIACATVTSRIDYCNSLIYGVTAANITHLQRIQNQLARVVCKAPYQSSATYLLRQLHWLPVI